MKTKTKTFRISFGFGQKYQFLLIMYHMELLDVDKEIFETIEDEISAQEALEFVAD